MRINLRSYINQIQGVSTLSSLSNPGEGFLRAIQGTTTDSGIKVSNFFAYNYTAYWRAVMLLSNDIAQIEKHLYERSDDGTERVTNRISRIVSSKPNQRQTQDQFYGTAANHLLNWGNLSIVVHRDALFRPVELELKLPWETTIYLTVEDRPHQRRKVFEFSDEPGTYYNQEDVIHVFRMSLDGIVGMNPLVYAARNSVALGMVSERYSSQFFANGGRGNGVISIKEEQAGFGAPAGIGNDEDDTDDFGSKQQLRESWDSTYGNADSFFKTMFLEPGEEYKSINTPPEALQLLNTRKFQISEIARIVGIPEYKLGGEQPKTADIEHQAIEYVSESVNPITRAICSEMDRKLLPTNTNRFFKFDTDALIQVDMKTRYEAYASGLGKNAPGFITPEYVQGREGLPHFNPSELFVPQNMNRQDFKPNAAE